MNADIWRLCRNPWHTGKWKWLSDSLQWMKLFRIDKGKCHYVNQSNIYWLNLPLASTVHAGIYENLNKFKDIILLVGFELVCKYLKHRMLFSLKTGFWDSPCESDDYVSSFLEGLRSQLAAGSPFYCHMVALTFSSHGFRSSLDFPLNPGQSGDGNVCWFEWKLSTDVSTLFSHLGASLSLQTVKEPIFPQKVIFGFGHRGKTTTSLPLRYREGTLNL